MTAPALISAYSPASRCACTAALLAARALAVGSAMARIVCGFRTDQPYRGILHAYRGCYTILGVKLSRRTTCQAADCSRPEHARGYCVRHYSKLLGTSALPRMPKPTTTSRLAERTGPSDPQTGCQQWTGNINAAGYAVFTLGRGNHFYAHREAWKLANGRTIPDGMQIDHECHNRDETCPGGACKHRSCVNPEHLALVTNGENARRSTHTQSTMNRTKTHCIRNHPFDSQHTYYLPNGMRRCRTCENQRRRERLAARRLK